MEYCGGGCGCRWSHERIDTRGASGIAQSRPTTLLKSQNGTAEFSDVGDTLVVPVTGIWYPCTTKCGLFIFISIELVANGKNAVQ